MKRALSIYIGAALCLLSPPALTWDATCKIDTLGTDCEEGPPMAFVRWRDLSNATDKRRDEHRELFDETLRRAAVDARLRADFTFDVFTAKEGDYVPAPFADVRARMTVTRTIAEFAQLPDYGFSLRDWATGFETCPPRPDTAVSLCRGLVGLGGLLNSNHFLPQSRQAYSRYHVLAQRRADECFQLATRIGDERHRFLEFIDQCEREALILEAVGQHFLQDSWSMGHMWQRWGTPDLAKFPGANDNEKLTRAGLVAAMTGMIHGFAASDAMAAPGPDIEYVVAGTPHRGIGDFNLRGLLGGADFLHQRESLFRCGVAGLMDIDSRARTGAPSAAPTALEDCFSARATNRALWRGYGALAALTPSLFYVVARRVRAFTSPELIELVRLGFRLWRAQSQNPRGTNMADGEIGPLFGVDVNSVYTAASGPIPSDEAPWPWEVSSVTPRLAPETVLTRTFHRAHATQWCEALTRADLNRLRGAALGKDRTSAEALLCAEMAIRHLHVIEKESAAPLDLSQLPPDLAQVLAVLGSVGAPTNPTACEPRRPDSAVDTSNPDGLPIDAPSNAPAPDPAAMNSPSDTSAASLCELIAPNSARVDYEVKPGELGPPTAEMALNWCLRPECTDCPSIGDTPDPTFVEIADFQVSPNRVGPQTAFESRWTLRLDTSGALQVNLHISPIPGLLPGASGLTNIANYAVYGGANVTMNTEAHVCERFDDGSVGVPGISCGNRSINLPYAPIGKPAYAVLEACAYCGTGSAQTCDVASRPIELTGF